ncbi:fluoride efflux transporter CrcB [Virgibacillus phasianinus]|uniref:fluoride efflux transporter CrcB n=1 Tax=Virgibacillus phasianinus TaxID=2017483 RepID=UPI001FE35EB4|nr:fluoride efflux transporter CrcB [Virgibacillus phasianinus]
MQSKKLYLAVGIGGMVGAACRYSLSYLMPTEESSFPFATLVANLLGCFLLSFLLNQFQIKRKLSKELFVAIGTGVIGSFTTFSTFMVETASLFADNLLLTISYVAISIIGGLLFCFAGYTLATRKRGAA